MPVCNFHIRFAILILVCNSHVLMYSSYIEFAIFTWICNFHISLQFSYQFAILMAKFQHLLMWRCMVLLLQSFHASKVLNVLMEMTRQEWKLTAAGMKTSSNSILSLHRESYGWILPWMLRATLHGGTESESTVTINCHPVCFVHALGLFANLKETREVKWACWVEVTSIMSVVKGVMVVVPKWKLWDLKVVYKREDLRACLFNHD